MTEPSKDSADMITVGSRKSDMYTYKPKKVGFMPEENISDNLEQPIYKSDTAFPLTESKKTPFRAVNEVKDMGIDTPEGFIGNANIEQGQTNEALVSKERSQST